MGKLLNEDGLTSTQSPPALVKWVRVPVAIPWMTISRTGTGRRQQGWVCNMLRQFLSWFNMLSLLKVPFYSVGLRLQLSRVTSSNGPLTNSRRPCPKMRSWDGDKCHDLTIPPFKSYPSADVPIAAPSSETSPFTSLSIPGPPEACKTSQLSPCTLYSTPHASPRLLATCHSPETSPEPLRSCANHSWTSLSLPDGPAPPIATLHPQPPKSSRLGHGQLAHDL
jgi:hypothetical protein